MNEQTVLQIQTDPRATIATILCREFDFQSTNLFKNELAGVAADDAKRPFILDLTNVGFMPSLTIGALIELRSRFAREKRPFALVGIQPAITKLLQTSGVLNMFEVRNNVTEAINEARETPPAQ